MFSFGAVAISILYGFDELKRINRYFHKVHKDSFANQLRKAAMAQLFKGYHPSVAAFIGRMLGPVANRPTLGDARNFFWALWDASVW